MPDGAGHPNVARLAAPPASPAPGARPRDRLVILGRRGAGKTVYLTRLYQQLSRARGELHVLALNGPAHRACVEMADELGAGRWPAETLGSWFLELEITFRGVQRRLFALDYPGEVFHRAFVENERSAETAELLDHLDRAAAVIALIDPGVASSEAKRDVVDDDYGMALAMQRLRGTPGGERVPVAIVFTKCDRHVRLLKEQGGLGSYLKEMYPNLLRRVGRFRLFGCAAAVARRNDAGDLAPDPSREPMRVAEPLTCCLETLMPAGPAAPVPAGGRAATLAGSRGVSLPRVVLWSALWGAGFLIVLVIALTTWLVVRYEPPRAAPPSLSRASPLAEPHTLEELEAAQLYELIQQTVCRVVVRQHIRLDRRRVAKVPVGFGTGFVARTDGLILTNRHVIDEDEIPEAPDETVVGHDIVLVFRYGDRTYELPAKSVGQSRRADLAWIIVDHRFPRALIFAPTPVPGQPVKAFGFPAVADGMSALYAQDEAEGRRYRDIIDRLGTSREPTIEDWLGGPGNLVPSVTAGIISAVRDTEEGLFLQTDTFVHHGNSGGPLVDAAGRVLGMVTFGSDEVESTNFCLAGYTIWEDLHDERGILWPEGW